MHIYFISKGRQKLDGFAQHLFRILFLFFRHIIISDIHMPYRAVRHTYFFSRFFLHIRLNPCKIPDFQSLFPMTVCQKQFNTICIRQNLQIFRQHIHCIQIFDCIVFDIFLYSLFKRDFPIPHSTFPLLTL